MYINSNNMAYINGSSGNYDGKIQNDSVRFGRNAYSNYEGYLGDYTKFEDALTQDTFDLSQLPPLDFDYQYMPDGTDYHNLDLMSLMGAAYGELGGANVSVEEMDKMMHEALGEDFTSKSLDINDDNMIDVGEYAANILLSDALDVDGQLTNKNIDGHITNKGQNKSAAYGYVGNMEAAKGIFTSLHEFYNLDEAKNIFLSDENNLI